MWSAFWSRSSSLPYFPPKPDSSTTAGGRQICRLPPSYLRVVLKEGDLTREPGHREDGCGNGEAHHADQGFHDRPGLQRGLDVHAKEAAHHPETGVVHVRGNDG